MDKRELSAIINKYRYFGDAVCPLQRIIASVAAIILMYAM